MRKSTAAYRELKSELSQSKKQKPNPSPPSHASTCSTSSDEEEEEAEAEAEVTINKNGEPSQQSQKQSTSGSKTPLSSKLKAKLKTPKIATAAFWQAQPGFEQIWKGKSTAGETSATAGKGHVIDVDGYARHLGPYRVGLKSLSRKQEYQVCGLGLETLECFY